jgi:hypothetical protein
LSSFRLGHQPPSGLKQTPSKEFNIEAQRSGPGIVGFFVGSEEIHQQRRQPTVLEHVGDVPVSRAVPATAASMGKEDDADRGIRNRQISVQGRLSDRNLDYSFRARSLFSRPMHLLPARRTLE